MTFRIIFETITCFCFQGCHIRGILYNIKLNRNPDQKINIIFIIFILKNL